MNEENNRLVALFMGAVVLNKPDSFEPEKIHTTYNFTGHPGNWRVDANEKTQFTSPMLCYHVDWSWLMPVVDKIEKLKGVYFDIYREATIVKYQPEEFKVWGVTQYDQESKITHVYKAVTAFITWYNQQSLTPKEK